MFPHFCYNKTQAQFKVLGDQSDDFSPSVHRKMVEDSAPPSTDVRFVSAQAYEQRAILNCDLRQLWLNSDGLFAENAQKRSFIRPTEQSCASLVPISLRTVQNSVEFRLPSFCLPSKPYDVSAKFAALNCTSSSSYRCR